MLTKHPVSLLLVSLGLSAGLSQAAPAIPRARTPIGDITSDTLDKEYAAERDYRPAGKKQPVVGLALSGGGTKAAMFAHGVLHGLQNKKILEQVDAISSVSGGSYAAYWYFSKMIESKRQNFAVADIFGDCIPAYWVEADADDKLKIAMTRAVKQGEAATPSIARCPTTDHYVSGDPYRWQAHLVRWPDVVQEKPIHLSGDKQPDQKRVIVKELVSGMITALKKRGRLEESLVPRLYQYGIERTWGLNPYPRTLASLREKDESKKWKYTNAADAPDVANVIRVNSETTSWADLRQLYAGNQADSARMPLWIVNANVDMKTHSAATNVRHIFEMTPFGFGAQGSESEPIGYTNDIIDLPIKDLGTSVRASAGFADAQGVESKGLRKALQVAARVMPGLQWGVETTIRMPEGSMKEIRLSDGGGGENLGLYSLLKRGVEDIIVVDTAADVEGDMSDLCAVKAALDLDKVVLSFPALPDLDDVCNPDKKKRYNMSAWMNPVVSGTAKWTVSGKESRIFLVKSAWRQKAVARTYTKGTCGDLGEASCFLAVFYGHNTKVQLSKTRTVTRGKTPTRETIKTGDMYFPQLSTAASTLNSSSYLFWGYRELGRDAVKNLSYNLVTGRLELDQRQCKQKALDRIPGLRPHEMGDGIACDEI